MNPVILVHGIDDTARLFDRMAARLAADGWAVHAINLVPNNGDLGLDRLAHQVADFVEQHAPDQRVDVVGFSMGGVVARYYVQHLAPAGRVERLVTVSSPHHGTWMGYLRGNTGARQLRRGSDFLAAMNREALPGVRFTSIWTPLDLMIVPPSSSQVAGARSVKIPVPAHALMPRSRRVIRAVEDALRD